MSHELRVVSPSATDRDQEINQTHSAQQAVSGGAATLEAVRSPAVLVLAVLAGVYTLYFGKEIILPIVLALVLKLLLAPAMRLLCDKLRFPRPMASLALILLLFGAIGAVGFAVSVPAAGWIKKAPESLPLLKDKLSVLRQPLDFLQDGLKQVENMAAKTDEQGTAPVLTVTQGAGLGGTLASGSFAILSRFLTTMILLFFMLAAGDRLLRGFVEVLPRFADKRQAVQIANEIEENITGYLLTITMMNALVGVAAGTAMWASGLGTPLLWGTTAFLLNYVPILGPLTGFVIFFVAGVLTLGWPWYALLPAGIYLLIHIVEGETITPMLLAKRFTLNPVLVIISLFFWHAVWGVPGALLAVPLLAMFKILCDHVDPLKPVGHVIGA